jgi:hypothetical protein
MITTQAKSGFDQLFKDAIKANLVAASDDVIVIEELQDATKIREKEVLVLTISTYFFRAITLFYFTANDRTKEHFARKNNLQDKGTDDRVFYDACAEFGNICAGHFNRELGHYFPHLGMSTPSFLESECLTFMPQLKKSEHLKNFKIVINDSMIFYAAICVCNDDTIDFTFKATEQDTSTGELEMF